MTTELFRHRLECLGWHFHSERQQPDGRWHVFATCCCHTILAIADSRHDAWAATCSMAMKLTWGERFSLPRP